MIEFLAIHLIYLEAFYVNTPDSWIQMDTVFAKANSPYFTGQTVINGSWYFYPHYDEFDNIDGENRRVYTRNSIYLLKGKDYEGQECNIFIENIDNVNVKMNHPKVFTDCKSLNALNSKDVISTLEKNTLHIHKPLTQVPDSGRKPATKQGKMEEFFYMANINGEIIKKRAQVYVPYGYNQNDTTKKYNVLYLMHGGSDNSTSFLKPGLGWLRLIDVLDHLIEDGMMDPILVVCPTFYEDDFNISAGSNKNGIDSIRDFNIELRKYLIPTVEKIYNTYYTGNEKDEIEKTRDHRGFGGFSMGSLCTWYQFYYDFDAVSRYIPLSGGIWLYNDDGQQLPANVSAKMINDKIKKSPYVNDFKIFSYTGTNDTAGNATKELVEELYKQELFSPKNMEFGLKVGGEHYYGHINEYLYHALPLLWKKENSTKEEKEEEKVLFYTE